MKQTDLKYLELLAQALNNPPGIKVQSAEPERLRQKLYRLMKKHPHYAGLKLLILNATHIAIVNPIVGSADATS